ncbi:BREX system Lon protease-like protein BrxL [Geofilum rubicundum]|uniref:Putative ATP-dependent protease n=1 Tax=Geofilum rubicundum JCM 15548 TaxID=1236989 RepID=A0A0E9LVQ7_9BACT|nr:BREX system Lon protease-like protein BrxL [Geofilum rubicundum]GAO28935.1 putative ATP-dependent protease [Geofilum rubicundum JCM 15548]
MELKAKILQHFDGKVVRKDLTKLVKGNAVVPTYVLEYLLGQHCASSDDEIVKQGVETVKGIIKKHFVHRDEAESVKHDILTNGNHRIIDKVSAKLNDKKGTYEAEFSNLGLKKVTIGNEIVKTHKKLLTSGVWCIINMGYVGGDDNTGSPWIIETLKPIQISHVDLEEFKSLRSHFSKDEWIDLLMQSIGLNPEQFNFRGKLIQLSRMVAFCENNYNLIELGPKGTGKSHIFSEMSPHGMLISGGEVTQAKLFVNNSNGQIGLVGYWDNVAFDEFAGISKKVDKNLVDTMKNYMANKTFSRGSTPYGATASFSFVGNTIHSVSFMLKHSDLFEALPKAYYDTAFLDRIHCYLPGWEVQKLRNELFTDGYGFIVDYLAEVLKELRKDDFSHIYSKYFELSESITTRDRTGILKTFSGLCKIMFPHGECSKEEAKQILDFALEGRRRVKNQLVIMDETFGEVDFSYTSLDDKKTISILTLEEKQYPALCKVTEGRDAEVDVKYIESLTIPNEKKNSELLSGKHLVVEENAKGISYEKLFVPYIKGASQVTVLDPYIRQFYQVKNFMEFIQMLLKNKQEGEDIELKLITKYDEFRETETEERLEQLKESIDGSGILFEYAFDQAQSFHARSIETNTGWKICMDRGLDIFQPYDFKNPFNLANNIQEERFCKAFEVTYLKDVE